MPTKTYRRKKMGGAKRKTSRKSRAPKATVALVKRVMKGEAETKSRMYFQGSTTDSLDVTFGQYADRTFTGKNQYISSNVTDIHRLIPIIQQGTGDNQRLGTRITPTSLIVRGNVQVNKSLLQSTSGPQERFAVIYVMQHVTLKDYNSLRVSNNFGAMLETGDQSTAAFMGDTMSMYLPVAKQNYRLLAKKIIPLRWAGIINPGTAPVSIANAHSYSVNFMFNLTKHLPKTIVYPEGTGVPNPTNTSMFMCVAYANQLWDVTVPQPSAVVGVDMTYVANLSYKDL